MFEHLSGYDEILVTGPQRSGTRIAAKIIAEDTNHRYVDESEFNTHSQKAFDLIMRFETNIVVQCPGVCHVIHKYSAGNRLIVMMFRSIDDVVASEKRIGWSRGYWDELLKYGIPYEKLRDARGRGVRPSELKYELWETLQRHNINNYLELEYESLSAHPLWVDKENRKNFKVEQTK